MRLARKIPFFWKAHEIVPGWSRTTNLSSFIERATHCATEKTPCRLAPKILFILLYTVCSLLFLIYNIVKKGDDTRVPTLPIDAR